MAGLAVSNATKRAIRPGAAQTVAPPSPSSAVRPSPQAPARAGTTVPGQGTGGGGDIRAKVAALSPEEREEILSFAQQAKQSGQTLGPEAQEVIQVILSMDQGGAGAAAAPAQAPAQAPAPPAAAPAPRPIPQPPSAPASPQAIPAAQAQQPVATAPIPTPASSNKGRKRRVLGTPRL